MAQQIELFDRELVKHPAYYVDIELSDGSHRKYATHRIPGLSVVGYGLDVESGYNPRIELFKGRASIAETKLILSDIDRQVRSLLSRDAPNSVAILYGGYRNLALNEFRIISSGHISGFELRSDGRYGITIRDNRTLIPGDLFDIIWGHGKLVNAVNPSQTTIGVGPTYSFDHTTQGWIPSPYKQDGEFPGGQHIVIDEEIMEVTNVDLSTVYVIRGELGTQAVSHASGSDVFDFFQFAGHPIDLILYALETGPTGGNGTYDLGIPGWGCDLSEDVIDVQSFLDYYAVSNFNICDFDFWLMDKEKADQFLEDEFMRLLLAYLLTDKEGRIRMRCLDIPTASGWPTGDPADLNEREMLKSLKWKYSSEYLFNKINFSMAHNPVSGSYGIESTYEAEESIDFYSNESSLDLPSRGLRMTSATGENQAHNYLLNLMRRIFDWSLQLIPTIEANLFMTRQMLEIGQRVNLAHRLIPNLNDSGDFEDLVMTVNSTTRHGPGYHETEFVPQGFPRRFTRDQELQGQYLTDITLIEGTAQNWIRGGPEYFNSDFMILDFEIVSAGSGDLDIRFSWLMSFQDDPVAEMTINFVYVNGTSNYVHTLPNFRDMTIFGVRWYQHDGTAPTSLKITRMRYYNDHWQYEPPVANGDSYAIHKLTPLQAVS